MHPRCNAVMRDVFVVYSRASSDHVAAASSGTVRIQITRGSRGDAVGMYREYTGTRCDISTIDGSVRPRPARRRLDARGPRIGSRVKSVAVSTLDRT